VSTLASFPYNQFDFLSQPTLSQRENAANFRIGSWNTIEGVDIMRQHLANDNGIVVGVNIFPGFERISAANPVFRTVNPNETHRGGHAIVLVGYCDDLQAFKFLNSWGTSWGVGGFGWICYELMRNPRVTSVWNGEPYGWIMNATDTRVHENFFEFEISNDEATITRYFGNGGDVVIPATLGGYPVTTIGASILQRANEGSSPFPTRLEIPHGVTSIEANAFFFNSASQVAQRVLLADVIIPESVTHIGNRAFHFSQLMSNAFHDTPLPYLTFHGYEGSFAQEYAALHLIPFAVIGSDAPVQRAVTFFLESGTRTGGGALRQLVNHGDDAIPPQVSRARHDFNGWDGEYTNVTSSRVLRALWTQHTNFTVTFDLAGGERFGGGQLTQTVYEGENASLPTLSPRPGYVFLGWDGDHRNITRDITITALWLHEFDARIVTFNLNGGTRTGGGETRQIIACGNDAVPPEVQRFSHVFDRWDGDYTNVTTDRTITAQWIALPTFPVALDPSGHGRSVNGINAWGYAWHDAAAHGETILVSMIVAGVAHAAGTHTFGVTSATVGELTQILEYMPTTLTVAAGEAVPPGGPPMVFIFAFTMPAHAVEDLKIIHEFTPSQTPRTITFNPNGGAFVNSSDEQRIVPCGESIGILPRATPAMFSRENYRFTGWFENLENENTRWRDNDIIDADITLHARWTPTPDDFVLGDINDDGRITSADATLLAMYVTHNEITICPLAADIDGDGFVTIADVILLARWLIGHDVEIALW
jgi:hypothetical protein